MKYNKTYLTKSGNPALIRNAEPSDAARIDRISRQCYIESPYLSRGADDRVAEDVEGTREWIIDTLEADREILLVAEIDGLIVGTGQLTGCGSRVKMLHRCDVALSLLKDYWNLGLGTCLMESLLVAARAAGYEQVELNVADANVYAVKLYENCGFEATGRLPRAMKYPDGSYSDFIMMVKYL